jgi:predicted glycosyltransferase
MKIWFDLSNSPHINLFAAMIRELQSEGHDVVITCRPLANTIDLLDLHGFRYEVVGTHYGGSFLKKVFGYPVRIYQLMRYLAGQRIDVAVSQSSFHSPVVARLMGIRSIYMNDNEHALGNVPSFLFADKIMVPEFFTDASLRKQFANPRKVQRYPGVKEGIYLWQMFERLEQMEPLGATDGRRPRVYVRPEPWTAQYYKGALNFLDDVLEGIKEDADVTVLPRGRAQGMHYRGPRFAGVRVVDTALDIKDIAPDCDLFIGAGGTMTREMAVMGVPTVSVYQDALLEVDKYLLGQGAFVHEPHLTAQRARELVRSASRRAPQRHLLNKGRQAFEMTKRAILAA